MSRDLFDAEIGFAISAENEDRLVYFLSGTAAPDGTSGEQGNAPIGSLYARSGTGELYQKIANAGAAGDWQLNNPTGANIGNWRPERVDAHTGQVLAAGTTDPTLWSDNDGGFDGTLATVGNYVLDGNCALFEITAAPNANSITLAAATTPPAADDMFAVRYNLPDPAGQENQAIITFDGTNCVKVADVDFGSATGVVLVAPYAAASGDPAAGDSVQAAIQKLDGNDDAQNTALGIAQGATDMGTYTGDIISDNVSQTQINQELETAIEANQPKQFTGTVAQSTPTNVDTVLVDEIQSVKWMVTARDTANPDRVRSRIVHAAHNGHGAADATNVDDTVYARLNLGAFNLQINTGVSGAGAAQIMFLELNTNEAGGITYTVERMHELPLGG